MALVLVVDDDDAIRNLTVALLAGIGYTVERAVNGADAMRTLSRVQPDCMVVDVMMPIMGGEELVRACKASPRLAGIPIVLFSAGRDGPALAERLGVRVWLGKPFDVGELEIAVRQAIAEEGV